MSSRLDAIRRVVDAFERSDWSEIDIATDEIRVHLAVGTPGRPPTDAPPTAAPAADPPTDEAGLAGSPDATTAAPSGDAAPPPDGAHVVTAPSPGIFWRSPHPGAPPFADVGDEVEASTTVCIVEVMKLMHHVKAGVRGTVVVVHGDNGVAVERGAPLFAIVPDETPA